MGSMISLGVGRMEIDWGKNNSFTDHSALFQPQDVKMIPYYYVGDDGKPIVVEQEGYSRKLQSIKMRLNLLGYTLEAVENKYNQMKEECKGIQKLEEHGYLLRLNVRNARGNFGSMPYVVFERPLPEEKRNILLYQLQHQLQQKHRKSHRLWTILWITLWTM